MNAVVTVPPHLARSLQRLLARALAREKRENGGVPMTLDFIRFLAELDAAAEAHANGSASTPIADSGNATVPDATVDVAQEMRAVSEVAAETGYSPRTIRDLAANGRVRAQRVGQRTWKVDPASVSDYLRRRQGE